MSFIIAGFVLLVALFAGIFLGGVEISTRQHSERLDLSLDGQ
jgi:hypothetical protein